VVFQFVTLVYQRLSHVNPWEWDEPRSHGLPAEMVIMIQELLDWGFWPAAERNGYNREKPSVNEDSTADILRNFHGDRMGYNQPYWDMCHGQVRWYIVYGPPSHAMGIHKLRRLSRSLWIDDQPCDQWQKSERWHNWWFQPIRKILVSGNRHRHRHHHHNHHHHHYHHHNHHHKSW